MLGDTLYILSKHRKILKLRVFEIFAVSTRVEDIGVALVLAYESEKLSQLGFDRFACRSQTGLINTPVLPTSPVNHPKIYQSRINLLVISESPASTRGRPASYGLQGGRKTRDVPTRWFVKHPKIRQGEKKSPVYFYWKISPVMATHNR